MHYWMSIVVALPLAVVVATGLLLQVKKSVPWIQPPEQRGSGSAPRLSFEEIVAICAAQPQVSVRSWAEIDRIDYRPERTLLKVTTTAGWEVQIDPADGRVLQTAVRRSDLIESLHDGSWFGGVVKSCVFLPAGVVLAGLWTSGLYLFALPQLRKLRKHSAT